MVDQIYEIFGIPLTFTINYETQFKFIYHTSKSTNYLSMNLWWSTKFTPRNLNDFVINVYHFEEDIWLRLPLSFQVIDISEMKYIKESQMLRQVNLLRNPIQELPDYRLPILFRMPSLTELDRHRVKVEEKVS